MTKKEAIKILQCRGDGYSEKDFNDALEMAYDALSVSSPPFNLDEAAHSYSESDEPLYSPGHRYHWDNESLFGKQIETAFKAGAEWMAGQGEVFDGFMSVKGKRSLIAIKGSSQNFKYGDNVIVQIRKKQQY